MYFIDQTLKYMKEKNPSLEEINTRLHNSITGGLYAKEASMLYESKEFKDLCIQMYGEEASIELCDESLLIA